MSLHRSIQITQSDDLTWHIKLEDYDPLSDTLSCFIRGQSALDLTGIPNGDRWDFTINSIQSQDLEPGKYRIQYVISVDGLRKAIAESDLIVCSSFESLTELETRSSDEIELAEITKAIAKLAGGAVAEYRIGDRMMRYQDLKQLTDRQQFLRTRIAIATGRIKPGGKNVKVRFSSS